MRNRQESERREPMPAIQPAPTEKGQETAAGRQPNRVKELRGEEMLKGRGGLEKGRWHDGELS